MTITLTDAEKLNMINQHIKNSITNTFNLQLTLISEQAVSAPNTEVIASINSQIDEQVARQLALEAEAEKLTV